MGVCVVLIFEGFSYAVFVAFFVFYLFRFLITPNRARFYHRNNLIGRNEQVKIQFGVFTCICRKRNLLYMVQSLCQMSFQFHDVKFKLPLIFKISCFISVGLATRQNSAVTHRVVLMSRKQLYPHTSNTYIHI